MPNTWIHKDERQYEHIKAKAMQRGLREESAMELAARTVNKPLRFERRSPQKTTQGAGNTSTSLESRTAQELYNRAKSMDIKNRSQMNKADLIKAIRERTS